LGNRILELRQGPIRCRTVEAGGFPCITIDLPGLLDLRQQQIHCFGESRGLARLEVPELCIGGEYQREKSIPSFLGHLARIRVREFL